jgi:hypothetical protein
MKLNQLCRFSACLREWGAAYARLEGPRSGCRQAMEARAGTLESGEKCPPWHFSPQVFLRKLACFLCYQMTPPPWGYLFKGEKYQEGLTGHGVPGTVLRWHSVREKILNITGFLFFCLMRLWKNPGVRIPVLP